MRLSLREKQTFYHSLAQLVRNGVPLPAALEKLSATNRGGARRLIRAVRAGIQAGKTVGESFARERPAVTPLESSVILAVEKSGQLERGLSELSKYFGALEQARSAIIKRCAYPVFLLHFGILVLNVPTYLLKSPAVFWHQTLTAFVFFYATVAIVAMLAPMLRDAGAVSAAMDRLLSMVPLIGKARRAFALSRFCTVYGLQLDAGVNVIDSLLAAGRASRSGMVRSAVDGAVPEVRGGAQVGPLLALSGAFPGDFVQSLIVGEETGSLDDELKRMSEELRLQALGTLEVLADWIPKLIYVGIVVYLAYRILSLVQTGILQPYESVLKDL